MCLPHLVVASILVGFYSEDGREESLQWSCAASIGVIYRVLNNLGATVKKFFALVLFPIGLLASPLDYELVSLVSGPQRTQEEILVETNKTLEDIASYRCDNENRNRLFSDESLQSDQKKSLIVIGSGGLGYIYSGGRYVDPDGSPIEKVKGSFAKAALKILKKLDSIPIGAKLIEQLQSSRFVIYIAEGWNHFRPSYDGTKKGYRGNNAGFIEGLDELRPRVERAEFSEIGSGGVVFWDPSTESLLMESDNKLRAIDPQVALGHEMFHAFDAMRGFLDLRLVKGDGLEITEVAEYRAVYFENLLRKELGYKYRRFLNSGDTNDMLDKNNMPILLPTPCVRWATLE